MGFISVSLGCNRFSGSVGMIPLQVFAGVTYMFRALRLTPVRSTLP